MPLICVVMRVLMARPAASSRAELMRRPEGRRSMERAMSKPLPVSARCSVSDEMSVLMTRLIGHGSGPARQVLADAVHNSETR